MSHRLFALMLVMTAVTKQVAAQPTDRLEVWRREVQQISQARTAAADSVMTAALANDPEAQDRAARDLLSIDANIQDLIAQLDDYRTTLKAELTAGARAARDSEDELRWLQQQLYVDRVSISGMQTELYQPGSTDQIAAATRTIRVAEEAISRIPLGAPARMELQRIKIEALLRSGQSESATAEVNSLLRSLDGASSPDLQALQIQIDLHRGDTDRAARRLSRHFGSAEAEVADSRAMDFARLAYLLATDSPELIGWLETIESRYGLPARRQAGRIVWQQLPTLRAPHTVLPALLAAEGRGWVGRQDHQRGGNLLAQAASTEPVAERALRYAVDGAAAWQAAGEISRAARLLIATAQTHRQAAGADQLHLHGVHLLAPQTPAELDGLLHEQLRLWPRNESARPARRWLQNRLQHQGRWVEAAEISSQAPPDQLADADVTAIFEAWQQALMVADQDEAAAVLSRFQAATEPLGDVACWQSRYRQIGALLLDRDSLATLPSAGTEADHFIEALLRWRQQGQIEEALQSPPPHFVPIATWRLMQDGRVAPDLRSSIAAIIRGWRAGEGASLQEAERLLWGGDVAAALTMLDAWISQAADQGTAAAAAAQLLSPDNAPEAGATAVQWWDQLAQQHIAGSPVWGIAKLSAIRGLQALGRHQEAGQRARFLLLTRSDLAPELKRQLQAIAP